MTIDKSTKIELDQNKLQELHNRSVKGRMLKLDQTRIDIIRRLYR